MAGRLDAGNALRHILNNGRRPIGPSPGNRSAFRAVSRCRRNARNDGHSTVETYMGIDTAIGRISPNSRDDPGELAVWLGFVSDNDDPSDLWLHSICGVT